MEIFEDKNHKIIHGDAIKALNEIADNSIDLIFADPPYNIGKIFNGHVEKWDSDEAYLNWCYQWIDLCIKKLKPNGSFYVMTSTQFMPYFDIYIRAKLNIMARCTNLSCSVLKIKTTIHLIQMIFWLRQKLGQKES